MSANLPRSLKISSHVLIFLQLNVTMFSLQSLERVLYSFEQKQTSGKRLGKKRLLNLGILH